MKLRIKFNLVLGIASLTGIALTALLVHQVLKQNAREAVLDSARVMMESALAVRSYTVAEIRPLLALQQKRQFLPQSVPAYAAHRYIANLQQEHDDYNYREAALNPTNPADRAADWEADIIQWFKSNNAETELIGTRETPTGPSLYLSRPIKITDAKCLACHSTPTNAPKTMVAMYGESNGFGWQLNEIVGAQIVSVPMSIPLERADQAFKIFMGLLIGVFALIVILLNVMLDFVVVRPVKNLSEQADQVSLGALETSELEVKGDDEIASLAQSFNRMHRSLVSAVKMLDEES